MPFRYSEMGNGAVKEVEATDAERWEEERNSKANEVSGGSCREDGDEIQTGNKHSGRRSRKSSVFNTETHRFSRPLPHRLDLLISEIEEKRELSDDHIDHAQALLREDFIRIGGLFSLSALAGAPSKDLIRPKARFVQILHVPERHHWICASNLFSEADSLALYDSFLQDKPSLSFDLREKLAAMIGRRTDIVLDWMDVKTQENSIDCGVYAIAAATDLCHGMAPESRDRDPEEMRRHLVSCFKAGHMAPFPVIDDCRYPNPSLTGRIEIHCCCCLPVKDDDTDTCHCTNCYRDYHKDCVKKLMKREETFLCDLCTLELNEAK